MRKVKIISMVVALLVAFVMLGFQKFGSGISNSDKIQVVVAAMTIPENTAITPDLVTIAYVKQSESISYMYSSVSEVVGKEFEIEFNAGDAIDRTFEVRDESESNMSPSDAVRTGDLADRLEQGMRAVTITVDEVTGITGLIKQGDHVDLATLVNGGQTVDANGNAVQSGESTLKVIVQDAIVLALDNSLDAPSPEYRKLTLQLSPEDALLVSYVQGTTGVRVLLRPTGDNEQVSYSQVNSGYVGAR